jgi:hypothetical protein
MSSPFPDWFREAARTVAAEAAEATAPATSPTPAPTADPDSPTGKVLAHAAAQDERAKLAEAARQFLSDDLPTRGYPATLAADLTDDEALQLSGIEERQLTRREQHDAYRSQQLNDPTERAIEQLDQRWWQLAKADRIAACADLGIDYEAAQKTKMEQAESWRAW